MTIEVIDGFDLYGDTTGMNAEWEFNGSPTFSTTGGRFGGGCAEMNSNSDSIRKTITNQAWVTWGFAFKSDLTEQVNLSYFSGIDRGSTFGDANGGIVIREDGAVRLIGDGISTIAISEPGVIVSNAWNYIECQIHRSNSGTGEIWVNGVSVISGAGDFDRSSSAALIVICALGGGGGTGLVIDDVYVDSSASAFPNVLGDCRIETLLPDADTAQADWTPLSGSGFSNIDDALSTNGDGDTSYISETTLNNKSEFDMESLSNSPVQVHAVAASSRASKTDSGSIEYTPYIDNGTELTGAAIAPLESAYTLEKDVFEEQPGSPTHWDEDSVNGIKLGFEVTA